MYLIRLNLLKWEPWISRFMTSIYKVIYLLTINLYRFEHQEIFHEISAFILQRRVFWLKKIVKMLEKKSVAERSGENGGCDKVSYSKLGCFYSVILAKYGRALPWSRFWHGSDVWVWFQKAIINNYVSDEQVYGQHNQLLVHLWFWNMFESFVMVSPLSRSFMIVMKDKFLIKSDYSIKKWIILIS